ncbi:hypothetical protein BJ508DRAFT_419078, partial [Ascobolus immersus RN42]
MKISQFLVIALPLMSLADAFPIQPPRNPANSENWSTDIEQQSKSEADQGWSATQSDGIFEEVDAEGKGILPEPPLRGVDGQPVQEVTITTTSTTTSCHTETMAPVTPAPAQGTSTALPVIDAPTLPVAPAPTPAPTQPEEEDEPCEEDAPATPAPVEGAPADGTNTEEPCDDEAPVAPPPGDALPGAGSPAPTTPQTPKEPCDDAATPGPVEGAPAKPAEGVDDEAPCDDEVEVAPAPVPTEGTPATPAAPESEEPCDEDTPSTPETPSPAPLEPEEDCDDEELTPSPVPVPTEPPVLAPSPEVPETVLPLPSEAPTTPESPVTEVACKKRISITAPTTCSALCTSNNISPKKFVELNPEVNDVYHKMYKAIKVATDGLRIRHGEEVHMDDDGVGTECEGVEIVEGGEYCV